MLSGNESGVRHSHSSLVLAVYIITFLIGLPANGVAFYTFGKKVRQKAMPIDILLLNLTVSDLLFLLFLPFKMKEAADNNVWNMPVFLCPLTSFVFYATIYNSTFFLTAISVERYLGVAFPIKYKLIRRSLYTTVASVAFWVISMAHVSIVYIIPYLVDSNATQEGNMCYTNFTQMQLRVLIPVRLELFLVLFCVPFFICCFCYINFIRILSQLPSIKPKKRLRAIGLSLATLLVFIVCFAPYNLSHLVGFVNWESPNWRMAALLSSTINASLDPIIFYFSSSALRCTFRLFLKNLLERVQGLYFCSKALYCPVLFCTRTQKDSIPSSNDIMCQTHSTEGQGSAGFRSTGVLD
ncbi:free fatty acid receptor 2-like [Oncorhynchus nerka]|uniref:free fatty acid receptor 2-like n=1 Tax=Oncorhynchus nerka TaxID=8023 RepID=UPI0011318E6A|nr:free fatty acid receptor 2-like [Oncorhynchus nerka]